jgi:Transposase, Mutator family
VRPAGKAVGGSTGGEDAGTICAGRTVVNSYSDPPTVLSPDNLHQALGHTRLPRLTHQHVRPLSGGVVFQERKNGAGRRRSQRRVVAGALDTRLWPRDEEHIIRPTSDLLGQDGLLQHLTKALVERALGGELTHHLGYEKHAPEGRGAGNSRNGTTPKTLRGKRGQVQIDVPRDRNSEFEPQLVKKGQTRFDGLDEKIISLYARGMTQREIQGHLEEIYGVEISPSLISTVTDAVMDEVRAWQARPVERAGMHALNDTRAVRDKLVAGLGLSYDTA